MDLQSIVDFNNRARHDKLMNFELFKKINCLCDVNGVNCVDSDFIINSYLDVFDNFNKILDYVKKIKEPFSKEKVIVLQITLHLELAKCVIINKKLLEKANNFIKTINASSEEIQKTAEDINKLILKNT